MQPSNEQGFALIEAIVSAAVLALIAVAILAGLDGATSSAGREKLRAVAASFAEEDQERMRSMQVEELASLSETRTVPDADGVQYTIQSESRWMRDDTGGTPSCTNDEPESDYLRISTVVTAPGQRAPAPVEVVSLVAPSVAYSSTRGSLAIKVVNRDDVPIENLAVSLSGASSQAKTTNEDGCALFEYIPTGNYVAQLNTPGWVDAWGREVAQGDAVVTSGKLNVETIVYDRKARVDVTFTTTRPGAAVPVVPSAGSAVSATNSDESGLRRVFTTGLPGADNLFPFKTPYAFYAGRCRESDPTLATPDYFQVAPGLAAAPALDPDGYETVSVRQPPLSLRVRDRRDDYWVTGAYVWAKLRTAAEDGVPCDEPVVEMRTRDNPWEPVGDPRRGWASRPVAPGAFDSGLPFGVYDLCVQYYDGGRNRRAYATYDNTAPTGRVGAPLLVIPTASGSC